MNTTLVKCAECKESFNKPTKEIVRAKKLGRKHFCSLTCSATYNNKHMSKENRQKCGMRIKKHAGNRQTQYSPFKPYLSKWRYSMMKHKNEINIDVFYLKELWERQGGICPYTGIKMLLPPNSGKQIHSLKKASMDRIDSSKGYLKGNVEFVCAAINLAKNSFTREEMKEFLSEIVVEPTGIEPVS